MRALVLIGAALVATIAASPLLAGDDPHGQTFNVQCASCHAGHKAAGSTLTAVAGNANLCNSCHNLAGTASAFPMERMIKADPVNHTGTSHAWDVTATNSNSGASTPSNPQMSVRLDAGKITCSVCHDQHKSSTAAIASQSAGTQQQSSVTQLTGSAAGKTVAYTSAATSAARGYILEIVEVGGATGVARFRLSNDGGVSWFGWNGTSWVAYAANGRVTAASVALNDGANVAVQFGGTFAIGDKFRFYVSYPFLRAATDSGTNAAGNKLCRDCHSSWVMDHNEVRTWDGSLKSHPVGVALNANAGGYDRALPLDANGAAQGSAGRDANSTNDLRLAADGTVQCLTCHGVHHADGNSTTVDTP